MKKLVVFTGSGISAESGLRTFREMGGLWEEYDVTDVASPEGWAKDMELVLRFYNERRRQLINSKPNSAHQALFELEEYFDIDIITQNVDDLHERAGSKNILHLHGELRKARSSFFPELVYEIEGSELNPGDLCEMGYQLRPHVVWFGEPVPMMDEAISICQKAEIFMVVGTSLNVYPAASLIDFIPAKCPVFLVDPNKITAPVNRKYEFIQEKASKGLQELKARLIREYLNI
jgi:NAD-dependent deacetylase